MDVFNLKNAVRLLIFNGFLNNPRHAFCRNYYCGIKICFLQFSAQMNIERLEISTQIVLEHVDLHRQLLCRNKVLKKSLNE